VSTIPKLSFTYQLDPDPIQVGRAREQVRKVLPGWGLAEHDDLLQLIVSELVTNAIAHCDYPIRVRMVYNGSDIVIGVWDNGNDMPVRRDPGDDGESGRGLQLIDGLIATHQGKRKIVKTERRPGKTVYITIPLPSGLAVVQPEKTVARHTLAAASGRRSSGSRRSIAWLISCAGTGFQAAMNDNDLVQARGLREQLDCLYRALAGMAATAAVDHLNAGTSAMRVRRAEHRLILGGSFDAVVALIAADAMQILVTSERGGLRAWQSPHCRMLYLARCRCTRLWCSLQRCGNRSGVAAHRARERSRA
jgi:anti-sigma regulatory factor (Ser/Thr protein kinase)